MIETQTFSEKLIHWFTDRKRDLPWRKTKDPYKVWLSEIILQQTRIDQGLPYYEKFVETFPTVQELALSPEEAVLRLWQGLGYYSRARNLHATAKFISQELNGYFPETYNQLIKLKGVGPYTAAAISSICFNEPRPVVDGNVFRFASRYCGIHEDIVLTKTRKIFEKKLSELISKEDPGTFNQAMMEHGSTVCTPTAKCDECGFLPECEAYRENLVTQLPLKSKKSKVRNRFLHYLVIHDGVNFLLKKRGNNDVWAHLFDFPVIENGDGQEYILHKIKEQLRSEFVVEQISHPIVHILSHQRIQATFYKIKIQPYRMQEVSKNLLSEQFSVREILNLPKSKLIVKYLSQIGIKQ